LLDQKSKLSFVYLILFSILSGLLDAVGVGSIMPFLAILMSPNSLFQNEYFISIFGLIDEIEYQKYQVIIGTTTLLIFSSAIICRGFLRYFQIKFCYNQENRISVALAQGYLHRNYEWFLKRNASKSSKHLLTDLTLLTESGYLVTTQLLSNLITIIFISTLLLFVNSNIFMISSAIISAFYIFLYVYLKRHIKKLGEDHYLTNEERFQTVQEIFLGIKPIKIFLLENKYIRIFTSSTRKYTDYNIKIRSYSELPRFIFEWLLFGGILLLATIKIANGNNTNEILPVLGLFAFAGYRLMPAVQQIYKCLTNLNFISEVSERIYADYESVSNIDFEAKQQSNPPISTYSLDDDTTCAVEMLDVVSGYTDSTSVLNGISLKIPNGSCVGLVGASGSGKTTTIDVIMGLLPAKSGELRLAGISSSNMLKVDLYSMIGYVPQDTYVFNGSLAQNICLETSTNNINRKKLSHICAITGLEQLGSGYEFDPFKINLGDRGARLSGGQRQRIGIARALYKSPSMLILDEATSALDGESETKILKELVKNSGSLTIIMITHRLDTLTICDNIFVLESGQISDKGKFDELLNRNKMFQSYMKRTKILSE
jgi:ABC-type multidrug transport system fused ATPase/permease subunit